MVGGWCAQKVYADLNGNGSLDSNEPAAVSNGEYNLVVPGAGTYVVRQVLPVGSVNSQPSEGSYTITIGDHAVLTGYDFGDLTGSVSGRVFCDTNGNGIADNGEGNDAQVLAYLDVNNDGRVDQPDVIANLSDGGTTYTMTSLPDGDYHVLFFSNSTFQTTASMESIITITNHSAATGPTFIYRPLLTIDGLDAATPLGVATSFTVTAHNPDGTVNTGYTGKVHFSSADAFADLPPEYTFTADDNGSHTFNVTFHTAGTQSMGVNDSNSNTVFRPLSVVVTLKTPDAPATLSASVGTSTDYVSLNWGASAGAASYDILRGTTNNSASASLLLNVSTSVYQDRTAVAGTTYYYWVRARNAAGTSAVSPSATGSRAVSYPSLPGRIEAENFDTGPEGTAYHDTESTNLGQANYRPGTGVDFETTTDSGNGYLLDYTKAGEWLNYTVSVPTAGNYTIDLRLTAPGTGGAFHLQEGTQNLTGPLTNFNTANWSTFRTITSNSISLTAGLHTFRLAFDTSGSSGFVGNINWMQFNPVAPPPPITAPLAPTGVTASDNTYSDKVHITWTAATGATAYDLYRSNTNDSSTAAKVNTADLTTPAFDDTTALAGTAYVYFVKAKNSAGPGNFSAGDFGTRATVVYPNLPGRIEAENFDNGAEGVAYHDTESKNTGSSNYRPTTGVDFETTADAGGGNVVDSVKAGEWLNYTVNVPTAGAYAVDFRLTAPGTGGAFHLQEGTSNLTGPLTNFNTANWAAYKTISSKSFALTAGQHTLRLFFDSNGSTGYVANFNWLQFNAVVPPAPPAPPTLPAAPTGVVASDTLIDKIHVTWNTTSGATAYDLYRSTTNDSTVAIKLNTADLNSPVYDDTTAAVGTTYYYFAKARNSTGPSPFSAADAGLRLAAPALPSLPGKLQFTDFNSGAEGVAYHDTDSANAGGANYRPGSGVDIQTTTDSGNGYAIGYVKAGEWLKYNVNVPAAGTFALDIRLSTATAGGIFHIEDESGFKVTGPITIPTASAKGWTTWSTLTVNGAVLHQGQHTLKIVFDTNASSGFVANFNWFQFR